LKIAKPKFHFSRVQTVQMSDLLFIRMLRDMLKRTYVQISGKGGRDSNLSCATIQYLFAISSTSLHSKYRLLRRGKGGIFT